MSRPGQLEELFGTPHPGAGVAELTYRLPYLNGDSYDGSLVAFYASRIGEGIPMVSAFGKPVTACTKHGGRNCAIGVIRDMQVHVDAIEVNVIDRLRMEAKRVQWAPVSVASFGRAIMDYKNWPAARKSMLWYVDDLAAEALALMRAFPDAPRVEVLDVLHRAVHSFNYEIIPRTTHAASPYIQWETLTRAAKTYCELQTAQAALRAQCGQCARCAQCAPNAHALHQQWEILSRAAKDYYELQVAQAACGPILLPHPATTAPAAEPAAPSRESFLLPYEDE